MSLNCLSYQRRKQESPRVGVTSSILERKFSYHLMDKSTGRGDIVSSGIQRDLWHVKVSSRDIHQMRNCIIAGLIDDSTIRSQHRKFDNGIQGGKWPDSKGNNILHDVIWGWYMLRPTVTTFSKVTFSR